MPLSGHLDGRLFCCSNLGLILQAGRTSNTHLRGLGWLPNASPRSGVDFK